MKNHNLYSQNLEINKNLFWGNDVEMVINEIENKKIIQDTELIKTFSDKIFVPTNVAKGNINNSFNSILEMLSKKAKTKILQKN